MIMSWPPYWWPLSFPWRSSTTTPLVDLRTSTVTTSPWSRYWRSPWRVRRDDSKEWWCVSKVQRERILPAWKGNADRRHAFEGVPSKHRKARRPRLSEHGKHVPHRNKACHVARRITTSPERRDPTGMADWQTVSTPWSLTVLQPARWIDGARRPHLQRQTDNHPNWLSDAPWSTRSTHLTWG